MGIGDARFALVTTGYGVPGLKAAMNLAGYAGGAPRAPLVPLPPATIDQIRIQLDRVLRASEQYA